MPDKGGEIGRPARPDDSHGLRTYLTEIKRFPRLTAHQEVDLAQRIERNEPDARQQMITANLRLVVGVARRFRGSRAPLLDLIQEGNAGLMRAVERFDWRRGFRFSSFAMQWIQQSIAHAAAEAEPPLRLPEYVHVKLATSRRIWDDLRAELRRDPEAADVAEAAGFEPSELARLQQISRPPASLESEHIDVDATPPHESRPLEPLEALRAKLLRTDINRALAMLDVRERTILRLRYGLGGREPLRLTDVGKRLGLTAERIRQLQAQALAKLARSSTGRALEAYAAG